MRAQAEPPARLVKSGHNSSIGPTVPSLISGEAQNLSRSACQLWI
jgi:hypothetical protein